jgi:endonuclease YncB( thermonuclease family)
VTGYAALALALGLIAVLLISGPRTKRPPQVAAGTAADARPAAPPAPPAAAPAAQDTAPGSLSGVPEIVDTATLRIGGNLVRLFGVEWARGAQIEDLKRYLADREIACTPAARADRHRCQVDGRDLSEVVLYNGGGRATADATPELKAAEDHARAAGWGVWQKP